jgi:ribosomal protein S1
MAQIITENISWSTLKKIMTIGEIVKGQVTRHAPYGVFVDLGIPFEGLIQITDFKDQGIMSPQEYPPVGQEIEAVVLGFKEFGHQIWLGMRPSQKNLISA